MSAYSYDRRKTAAATDDAVKALNQLKTMGPKFRMALKELNKALPRAGLPKLRDVEGHFEHVIDAIQATEYDLVQQ